MEKKKALCEVCNNTVKRYQAVFIKDTPTFYKRFLPYKKLRHKDCLICMVCGDKVSSKNFHFIGNPTWGLGYCADSCYPGSPSWMTSKVGQSSKYRDLFKRARSCPEDADSSSNNESSNIKNHPPHVKELINQTLKTKDKEQRKKLRRKLRKMGIYLSKVKKSL
ncbi:MAG: hypothetical protein D6785_16350 [Planctomycetota bacterium]|nr:MAG: hypothetical protein D6785_16350 [Planctomycetota bacterium]